LTQLLPREAKALAEAGIDVVQIDDPALTYFCDRRLMAGETHDDRLRRDRDPRREIPPAVNAVKALAQGPKARGPPHRCHRVYTPRSDVSGDYKPLLPWLERVEVDRVNLEFAYPGTGDVSDLALLPAHLEVGLGVIDVRGERLQSVEEIESLAASAARLLPP